ncbi:acetyltransferase [Bordetella ansorpii]|uniref:Protein ElaA n=1 Tax=Bordetella ansorpii TaxID=288768 RepID=A0A157MMR5_9BORD|nr:GNAT family N-acetyltransferase [Bordetella ansorpii]SAI10357.1 acetyltransferase [Bordetella ansorpii]
MPTWICKHHTDLTTAELYALLRLRSEVFVVEQQCIFLDLDGQDLAGDTWHLMGWKDGRLVAGARLLDPGSHAGDAVIGRVVTAQDARGNGLGHELMRQALHEISRLWPAHPVYLGAQHRLQGFYAGHGFTPATEIYMEDGIAHIGMRRHNANTA